MNTAPNAIKAVLNGADPQQTALNGANKKRHKKDDSDFPVDPVSIQVIKTPRGTMNHSYRDFSRVPARVDYEHPAEIKDMRFAQKVHHILSQSEYTRWISWMPHGRAFKVHVPVLFESQVCPKYFGHKRYSSFLRELNNHGFKHITKGTDRNCKCRSACWRYSTHMKHFRSSPILHFIF